MRFPKRQINATASSNPPTSKTAKRNGMRSMGSGTDNTCALPMAIRKRVTAAASRMAPAQRMKYRIHFMVSFLKDEVFFLPGPFESAISAHQEMRFTRMRIKLYNDAGFQSLRLILFETILFMFFAAGIQQYFGPRLEPGRF